MLKNMTKYMWQQTEAYDRVLSADEKQQIGKTLYALLGESADLLNEQVITAIAWLIWWEMGTHNHAWLESSGLTLLLDVLLKSTALDAQARDQQLPYLNRALNCIVEALLLVMPHLEAGETLPNYPRTPHTISEPEIERNNLNKRESFKPVRRKEYVLFLAARTEQRYLQVANKLFQVISTLWLSITALIVTDVNAAPVNLQMTRVTTSISCCRILKTLLVQYTAQFVKDSSLPVQSLYQGVHHVLNTLTNQSVAVLTENSLRAHKYWSLVHAMNRLVLETQSAHPLSFAAYLEPYLAFYFQQQQQWSAQLHEVSALLEEHLVQAMSFQAQVLSCYDYKDSAQDMMRYRTRGKHGLPLEDLESIEQSRIDLGARAVQQVYNETRQGELLELLLTKYMRMNSGMLELWQHDPESLIDEELSDAFQQRVAVRANSCASLSPRTHSLTPSPPSPALSGCTSCSCATTATSWRRSCCHSCRTCSIAARR
jgi:hypothetical protein